MISQITKKIVLDNAVKIEKNDKKTTHLYFLIKGNEIVYVGQTTDIAYRLLSHLREKDFDYYSSIEIPSEKALVYEAEMILQFDPILNVTFPSQDKYWSYAKIKQQYGISRRKAISLIGDECVYFRKHRYVVMTPEKHKVLSEASI